MLNRKNIKSSLNEKFGINLFAGLFLFLLLYTDLHADTDMARGSLIFNNVHSQALEGNLLGDSANRSVIIYLPPSYKANPDKRYPVLYLLHGNGAHNTLWLGRMGGWFINVAMDKMIASGNAKEMIIVMPDASNRYIGSQYTNSSVSGGWTDFIVNDLVKFIDDNYRTLAKPESRGLAGHSMGGRATWYIAMTRPGVFSSIYSLSAAALGFQDYSPGFHNKKAWAQVLSMKDLNMANDTARKLIGYSVAFSPNPDNKPFMTDFPYQQTNGDVQLNQSAWQKWLANDPMEMLGEYGKNLKKLKAIMHDCGNKGPFIKPNRAFSKALTHNGIRHDYEEFDGNHVNRLPLRIQSKVLPFFSKELRH